MEDIIDINNKGCSYTVVQKEVPNKRKGYIILKKVNEYCYQDIVEVAANQLIAIGAEKIYLTCTDKNAAIFEEVIQTKNYAFQYDSDMDCLEREILSTDSFDGDEDLLFTKLSLENQKDFLCTYNECFFDVPNSATYTDADINRLINDSTNFQAGLIIQNKKVIGIYEISMETETPEIASIGIIQEKRGQRLGWKALNFLLKFLSQTECKRVSLKVSTKNPNAYTLYLKMGFSKMDTLSKWYLLNIKK
jgi:ribosomal protein S18 acetylase RimI-like enzyme